jgi:uncharacterized membrane protein YdjX (TVP38/TMEM64 family)
MRQLITLALCLMAIFASTFLLIKITGLLTLEDIRYWLQAASQAHSISVALIIVLLLTSDLIIAVPTLSLCILSGYFLGFFWGGVTASVGMLCAGSLGYAICYKFGKKFLQKIYKDEHKLNEMQQLFNHQGGKIILISRALPMLPEVCSCLAGSNRMAFTQFLFFFSIATTPYAFVAAFAGSHSSFDNPLPALIVVIGLPLCLWIFWIFWIKPEITKHISRTNVR